MTKNTERHRLECEARFWITWERINGMNEWRKAKSRMIRRRGTANVERLTQEMNRQRNVASMRFQGVGRVKEQS